MPQNIEVEATPDKTLLQIATENNLEIKSICKGVPSCAECRVRISSGEQNLIPPAKAELSLIGSSYFIDSRRLSCQVHCFGDVTVDLTEQVERSENQTKKVRGFRISKSMESKAVQDTMILNEKPDPNAAASHGRDLSRDPARNGASENPHDNEKTARDGQRDNLRDRALQENRGRNQRGGHNENRQGGKRGGRGGQARNQNRNQPRDPARADGPAASAGVNPAREANRQNDGPRNGNPQASSRPPRNSDQARPEAAKRDNNSRNDRKR